MCRHEHLLNSAESRVRLLGSIQTRRDELTEEERRALDFKLPQSAAHAMILGSRKLSAADILGMGSTNTPAVPITAPSGSGESLQAYPAEAQSAIWLRKISDVPPQVRP